MARTIFLTGGGGFVGARLLDAFSRRGDSVLALDRSGAILRHPKRSDDIQVIRGDLVDPRSYLQSLTRADIVVHLASSTGKAAAEEHHRVIASGTAALIEACSRAGVRKVLYVSSIAASFPQVRNYPYAQAKLCAEEVVRSSGLAYAILRPTMILGPGSPILAALERLALLPVMPVFGTGKTRVQPVFVDDVVESILTVLDDNLFTNETFDIAGPDVVTIEQLMQDIRQARTGSRGRVLHVPLRLLLHPLRCAELLGLESVCPVSAGQLSSFRYDGTGAANSLVERCKSKLRTLRQMVSLSAGQRPTEAERECVVFSQYLLGARPDAYVKRKYADATAVVDGLVPKDPYDAFLVRFAARHRFCTKLADAYARVFVSGATLHRKLILLLAILESCPTSSRVVDAPVEGHQALLPLRLAIRGCLSVFSLLLGAVILAPARLAFANRRAQAALTHD